MAWLSPYSSNRFQVFSYTWIQIRSNGAIILLDNRTFRFFLRAAISAYRVITRDDRSCQSSECSTRFHCPHASPQYPGNASRRSDVTTVRLVLHAFQRTEAIYCFESIDIMEFVNICIHCHSPIKRQKFERKNFMAGYRRDLSFPQ